MTCVASISLFRSSNLAHLKSMFGICIMASIRMHRCFFFSCKWMTYCCVCRISFKEFGVSSYNIIHDTFMHTRYISDLFAGRHWMSESLSGDEHIPLFQIQDTPMQRRWRMAFIYIIIIPIALLVVCVVSHYYMGHMYPPFSFQNCALGPSNRIPYDGTDYEYNILSHTWATSTCQNFYTCNNPTLFIDRTCTKEDMVVSSPQAHIGNVMVSHKYRTVYVINPTNVNEIIIGLLANYTGAIMLQSNEISDTIIKTYFFFSFVQNPYDRFLYAAGKAVMATMNKTNDLCTVWVEQFSTLKPLNIVASQAHILSTEGGRTNKMIHLDFLADTLQIKGALIEVKPKALVRFNMYAYTDFVFMTNRFYWKYKTNLCCVSPPSIFVTSALILACIPHIMFFFRVVQPCFKTR